MKHLIKAWREYKESLRPVLVEGATTYEWTGGYTIVPNYQTTYPDASFEGFMDYLVRKEKQKKERR